MNSLKTILFFALFFSLLVANGQKYNFRQFSVEDGLSQSQVFDISQDAYGNMWFATYGGGITVYNGTTVKYYSTNEGLPSYSVQTLFYSSDSLMWVGTIEGLVYFKNDQIVDVDPNNIITSTVRAFAEDRNGTIWIGTDYGLWKYESGSIKEVKLPDLNEPQINSICVDLNGKLWISTTEGGVIIYDGEIFVNNVFPDLKVVVEEIYQDYEGIIWMATSSGAYFYENNKITQLTRNLKNPNSSFLSIYKDLNGNIWLGREDKGLIIIRADETVYLGRYQGLGFIGIYEIFADKSGDIWIATDGGGVSVFNGFLFSHYDFSDISNNFIMKILIDSKNNKWLGTDGDGVIFMSESRRFIFTDKDGLADNSINSIVEDKNGNIWFATNKGISKYNGFSFKNYHASDGLISDTILSILAAENGDIWCASIGYGISRFNGKEFHNYYTEGNYLEDYIWHIYQAKDGNIYFATEMGLKVFDGKEFKIYNEKDGLHANSISSITEDSYGNIWVCSKGVSYFNGKEIKELDLDKYSQSNYYYFLHFDKTGYLLAGTEKGLDRISLNKNNTVKNIKHFDKSDGFIGIECNDNAVEEDSKGHVWIGTIKGLTLYKPEEIFIDTIQPITAITDVKLFYEKTDWTPFAKGFTEEYKLPKNLRLPYNQSTLTFEFIAINYNVPEKVRYQYKLEGLDEAWQPVTTSNEATFTNLPHGQYAFHVKACNHDGVWNTEPVVYHFEILSPYWLKWWFIVIVILLLAVLIYGYIFLNTLRLKRLHTMLTQKVTERTRLLNQQKNELVSALKINKEQNEKLELAYEKVKESSRLKEIFLANTSHEIRTPLNVIIGFTNLLLKSKLERKQLSYLNNIRVSGNNLLVVLNDILDFSKIEANKLTLEKTDFNIREVISNCYTASSVKAKEKKLDFTNSIADDIPEYINGDPVRLSQILTNLIRNAIKFTNDLGKVSIKVELLDEKKNVVYLLFRVVDTGIGISKEHQQKIFESFTQAKSDMTRKYGGTGLGLTIVKQLVDMHNGEITLDSEKGKGSSFSFTIGYKKSDVEKVKHNKQIEKEKLEKVDYASHILLVDDNVLNVSLAVDTITSFNNRIKIDVAENGKIGVEKAQTTDYDLIIMDIQMPVMDGYEATTYIRNQFPKSKSNVPILGMTAHAMKEEKDKCFELGMNDYLTKPFVPEELFTKITNLVSSLSSDDIVKLKNEEKESITEIDLKYLDLEVLNKTYKGNKLKIAKIVELCINNIPKQITELQAHFDDKSWKNLRVIAHSLKTSLNYLGLKKLREAALSIEKNAAEEINLDKVPELVKTITLGWKDAIKELEMVLIDLKK